MGWTMGRRRGLLTIALFGAMSCAVDVGDADRKVEEGADEAPDSEVQRVAMALSGRACGAREAVWENPLADHRPSDMCPDIETSRGEWKGTWLFGRLAPSGLRGFCSFRWVAGAKAAATPLKPGLSTPPSFQPVQPAQPTPPTPPPSGSASINQVSRAKLVLAPGLLKVFAPPPDQQDLVELYVGATSTTTCRCPSSTVRTSPQPERRARTRCGTRLETCCGPWRGVCPGPRPSLRRPGWPCWTPQPNPSRRSRQTPMVTVG
jgi:hypothetical protein